MLNQKRFVQYVKDLFYKVRGVYVITAFWSKDSAEVIVAQRSAMLDAIGFMKGRHFTTLICVPGDTAEEQGEEKRKICEQMNVQLMFEDRANFTDQISATTRCLLLQPRP